MELTPGFRRFLTIACWLSWLTSCVFIGFLIFEFPMNIHLKGSIAVGTLIVWGTCFIPVRSAPARVNMVFVSQMIVAMYGFIIVAVVGYFGGNIYAMIWALVFAVITAGIGLAFLFKG